MNDQVWAIIVGAITVIILRIVDFYLPKGYHSKWAHEHAVREEEDELLSDEGRGEAGEPGEPGRGGQGGRGGRGTKGKQGKRGQRGERGRSWDDED